MAYMRIVPRNWHDEATLSTELASVLGASITNTQNRIRSRIWKTTSGADQYTLGTFDDGLARTFSYVGFFRHRCHGGNVRYQLYSDDSWTTQVLDTGALPVVNIVPTDGADWGIDPYGTGTLDPFLLDAPWWAWITPTPCLSYKISFSSNVSTFGAAYWQVCRFWAGHYRELVKPPDFGASLGIVDQTDRNRSRGGSLRTNVGPDWLDMVCDLNNIKESERAAWLDTLRYAGTGRDIVVSWFPEDGTRKERDHHANVLFKNLNSFNRQVSRLTGKLQFEEV